MAIIGSGDLRRMFVSDVVTTNAQGTVSVPHGFPQPTTPPSASSVENIPAVAVAIPVDGEDGSGVVATADATNIVLTNGGNAQKYRVFAFGV